MESLQNSLSNMSELFHKRMASFEAELPKAQGTVSMASLAAEYASFKTFVMELLSNFQQQLDLLVHTVDAMEMRGRRKMLLLHGVPEEKKQDLPEVIVEIVKKHTELSNFTGGDIRRCHRMGRSSSAHKPRPIVIKFHSTSIRDSLWFTKTKFKGSGITISEFLTKQRHQIFMEARLKYGVSHCWTQEGIIYVIGSDGTKHRVTSPGELHNIKLQDEEKPVVITKPVSKSKKGISQKK